MKPRQSNKYVAPGIKIGSNDPGQLAKLADAINLVETEMDLWLDDNGQRVDYSGTKTFVTGYDARINTAMSIILNEKYVGGPDKQNPAYQIGIHKTHSMYNDIDALRPVYGKVGADGKVTVNSNPNDRSGQLLGFGMFIVNKTYMSENNGLTFLERLPLTIKGISLGQSDMNPEGVGYKGYCRFDIVNCTWRGIAYLWIGDTRAMPDTLKITSSDLKTLYSLTNADTTQTAAASLTTDSTTMAQGTGSFTLITPIETLVKPVAITGTVKTETAGA